jgi:carbon monoxide dehydrogenase subunit G
MSMATHEVKIERSPHDVFAFLADGENDPKWRPGVADVKRESGEGAGAVFRQGVKGPMGKRVDADYRLTEYDPDSALAFEVIAGPVRPHGRYELLPDGDSTRVRFTLECELSGAKKLMMRRSVEKSMRDEVANLERLKSVLEFRC